MANRGIALLSQPLNYFGTHSPNVLKIQNLIQQLDFINSDACVIFLVHLLTQSQYWENQPHKHDKNYSAALNNFRLQTISYLIANYNKVGKELCEIYRGLTLKLFESIREHVALSKEEKILLDALKSAETEDYVSIALNKEIKDLVQTEEKSNDKPKTADNSNTPQLVPSISAKIKENYLKTLPPSSVTNGNKATFHKKPATSTTPLIEEYIPELDMSESEEGCCKGCVIL